MKLDAVDQLKQAIGLPLRALSQRFIVYSIGEWRHSYLTVDLASLSNITQIFKGILFVRSFFGGGLWTPSAV